MIKFIEFQIFLDLLSIIGACVVAGVTMMDSEPLPGIMMICIAVTLAASFHVFFMFEKAIDHVKERYRAKL